MTTILKPRHFWCGDLRAVGVEFTCCSSCHEEVDDGYVDAMTYDRGGWAHPTDILTHCCTCPEPTEAQWDAMVEAKEKAT
jgi:hypothetical protein